MGYDGWEIGNDGGLKFYFPLHSVGMEKGHGLGWGYVMVTIISI